MTPKQLLEKLELLGIDEKILGKIRDQVEDPNKKVKTSAVLSFLVKKKQITESQARKLMKQSAAAPKKPAVPETPKHNTEDLTSNFVSEDPAPKQTQNDKTQLDMAADFAVPAEPVPVPQEALEAPLLDDAALVEDAYGDDGGFGQPEYIAETAHSAPAGSQIPKSFTGKKDRKNQWLSKWPYIAFFIIGLLMIFGVTLAINVFNQKPEEQFKAAMKHFTDGSYQAAEKGFREYVEENPSHTYVAKAKARRVQCVMAATFATKNWEETIRSGETLLPELLEDEESELNLIREDVALMLARSLDEHTTKLAGISELGKMESGLQVAQGYKKLVDNPAYVPTSSRKSPTIKRHLDTIDNNIQTVEGSIQKEKDYTTSLSAIKTLGGEGQTEEAFREFQTLTRNYPDLAARKELRDIMFVISEKEQELVVPANVSLTVNDSLAQSIIENTVVLSSTTGESVESLRGEVIPCLVDGAVYGFDAGTGAIAWRQFVGFQSTHQPQMYDDETILISDLNQSQLLRVNRKTGQLIWRSEIGEPFLAPSISDDKIAVSTQTGTVMLVDPATGNATVSAKLPQVLSVNSLVARNDPYIYQPGHYSNIYVLSTTDLSCKEVFYLGHYKGSIVIPPYYYNGYLIVTVNGGDYADMFVLKPEENGLNLKPIQILRRVTNGPITTPLRKFGRRLLAVADNGEMQILEFNQGDDLTPIGKLASGKFDNGDGEQAFIATEGSNLWVAGKGALRYRIQSNLGQFEFVDIKEHADSFICPPYKLDDKMFYVRKRDGSGMVSASLNDAMSLKPIWRTDFGGNLGSELKRTGDGLMAVSNQGDLFSINADALAKKYIKSVGRASDIVETLQFEDAVPIGENQFAYVGPAGSKDFLLVDGASASSKLMQMLPPSDRPACPSIAMGGELIVANSSGQVARIDIRSGGMKGEPFQPPVRPSEKVNWIRPTPVDETTFVIASSGSDKGSPSVLYVLDVKGPQSVSSLGNLPSSGNYIGELAADGTNVFVVERTAGGEKLLKLDVSSGTPSIAGGLDLAGSLVAGPWLSGSELYLQLDSDQLVCVGQDMAAKWSKNMPNDRLACPPQNLGQLVLLFQSGRLAIVNSADGEDSNVIELGQPVSRKPVVVGQKMFFSGFDGTVHVIDLGTLGVGAPKP
jgi:outer membrane protein assembly factor BamB/TolA-binding protein